jgi:transposase
VTQSLLSTCRVQGIDPYTYLVDVLHWTGRHPAKDVTLLTPRLWKENFAGDPLQSDVDRSPVACRG